MTRYIGSLVLVAAVYYGAGRIGLELAYLDGAVAALWPPAGLGLAVLFLYGVRLWPAIVVGDLLQKYGIDPKELAGKLPGGVGDKLGL